MKLDELRERSSTKRETAEDAAKTFEESRIVEAQQLCASFSCRHLAAVPGYFRCGMLSVR